jgi:uncharacterized delta-60 repeat protein
LAGVTYTFAPYGAGDGDFWLIKTNAAGDSLWSRTFGGDAYDACYSAAPTSDGGYVLAGGTRSFGAGGPDFYLIRVNENGTQVWSRTFGGSEWDECYSITQTSDGGYVLAGYTESFGSGRQDFWLVKTNANGDSLWSRTYGGSERDECRSVRQTSDGGYILAGETESFGAGRTDFWLVKTDENGTLLWSRTFGGSDLDGCRSLLLASDGGYLLAGNTDSYASGSAMWLLKTNGAGDSLWSRTYGSYMDWCQSALQTSDGGYLLAGGTMSVGTSDYLLAKTDANGESLWSHTYGGIGNDDCQEVLQTSDGGYILAGQTESFGTGIHEQPDFWLVRIDGSGTQLWDRTFGGADIEECNAAIQSSDGGYLLGGYTWSRGAGQNDFLLVKADADGTELWRRTYGGHAGDECLSMAQTFDGGYILAGVTESFGAGYYDFWLVKTDENGDSLWSRTFGTSNAELCYSVQQTSDSGYILAGRAGWDFWLLKTDPQGDHSWDHTYGGQGSNFCYSVEQTSDGGYILAGTTDSFGAGSKDFWVVRADANGDSLWSRSFGGSDYDVGRCVKQTSDGGYVVAGEVRSFGVEFAAFWLIRLNADGDSLWSRIYEGPGWDFCQSIDITADGGYVLAGECWPSGEGSSDFWVVRTDENGTPLWNGSFGGSGSEYCRSVQQTSDGGYFLAGSTSSFGTGGTDFWLVRMGPELPTDPLSISLPVEYALRQNWPNPFNSSTRISYDIAQTGRVSLKVFDVLGQEVTTLVDGVLPAGSHTILWNTADLATGVYFYRLQTGNWAQTKKMVLLK